MRRQLPQAALTEWSRRLNDQDPEQSADPQAQRLRIVKAVGRATVQWLDDELRDREGLYETRALTPDEEERAFLIETVLDGRPGSILRSTRTLGRRPQDHRTGQSYGPTCGGDKQSKLAQAKASSGNPREHRVWTRQCVLCRCTRAGRPEGNEHYGQLALKSSILAVWPDIPTSAQATGQILNRHWSAITDGGLKDVAAGAKKVWEQLVKEGLNERYIEEMQPTAWRKHGTQKSIGETRRRTRGSNERRMELEVIATQGQPR